MEFGEKIKSLREKQGMTQQSLADKLFVTRQSVSRWEGGSRYPDLITAKQLANILNVTLDELLSSEELETIASKQVLSDKKKEIIIQTFIYTIGFFVFGFLFVMTFISFLGQEMSIRDVTYILSYFVVAMSMFAGIYLSLKEKLLPQYMGVILSLPLISIALQVIVNIYNQIYFLESLNNILSSVVTLVVLLFSTAIIYIYFVISERHISFKIIFVLAVLGIIMSIIQSATIIYANMTSYIIFTQLFNLSGKIALCLLLSFQGYRVKKQFCL